jgi:hypothetical protein
MAAKGIASEAFRSGIFRKQNNPAFLKLPERLGNHLSVASFRSTGSAETSFRGLTA